VTTSPDELLQSTLKSLSPAQLLLELQTICANHPEAKKAIQDKLFVKGKDIVRYHADAESEDESDNSDAEDEGPKAKQTIPIADEELTSRHAKCLNCDEEFDVTNNQRGACFWHTGENTILSPTELI
jgi:hypothetical protein